jgi:hypothetical protein
MPLIPFVIAIALLVAYWWQTLIGISVISALAFFVWRVKKNDVASKELLVSNEIKRRENMIASGMAFRAVKIAPSGKGGCYHSADCGMCRSHVYIDILDARKLAYVPCSTCGGSPTYMEGKKRSDGSLVSN